MWRPYCSRDTFTPLRYGVILFLSIPGTLVVHVRVDVRPTVEVPGHDVTRVTKAALGLPLVGLEWTLGIHVERLVFEHS